MDSFCRRKGGTGADGARLTLFCTKEGGDCRLKFCNYQDGGERRNSDSSRSAFEYLAQKVEKRLETITLPVQHICPSWCAFGCCRCHPQRDQPAFKYRTVIAILPGKTIFALMKQQFKIIRSQFYHINRLSSLTFLQPNQHMSQPLPKYKRLLY